MPSFFPSHIAPQAWEREQDFSVSSYDELRPYAADVCRVLEEVCACDIVEIEDELRAFQGWMDHCCGGGSDVLRFEGMELPVPEVSRPVSEIVASVHEALDLFGRPCERIRERVIASSLDTESIVISSEEMGALSGALAHASASTRMVDRKVISVARRRKVLPGRGDEESHFQHKRFRLLSDLESLVRGERERPDVDFSEAYQQRKNKERARELRAMRQAIDFHIDMAKAYIGSGKSPVKGFDEQIALFVPSSRNVDTLIALFIEGIREENIPAERLSKVLWHEYVSEWHQPQGCESTANLCNTLFRPFLNHLQLDPRQHRFQAYGYFSEVFRELAEQANEDLAELALYLGAAKTKYDDGVLPSQPEAFYQPLSDEGLAILREKFPQQVSFFGGEGSAPNPSVEDILEKIFADLAGQIKGLEGGRRS